jgi:DNA (cytosine-5)-methyltransferase 1
LRVLKEALPKTFLLENVKGLAYGIHSQALDHILKSARDLGYEVDWQVVNAANFGVPQIRERCIVIGSLYGKIETIKQSHYKADEKTTGENRWRTAGDVLLDLPSSSNDEIDGHFAGGKHHKELLEIPPGDNYLYFTKERGYKKPKFKWRSRYWSFLLKLSPELPSWTIQARRSNNMGPFHWNSRILTISEIKRLQTFPDNYQLSGTLEKQWRQIGNAVPPELARKIGLAIANHIRKNQ